MRAAVLPAAFLLAASPLVAQEAQRPAPDSSLTAATILDPVVVTAERRPTRSSDAAVAVRVVSRDEILRKGGTDLSATLFFAEPEEYDGGVLCIEDTYGTQEVKLPAGDMVLYPSTSLHHVTPVTRGARVSSFFWLQSMIRSDERRTLLYDLDLATQRLGAECAGIEAAEKSAVQLTGVYHNLLRQWAEM